MIPRMKLEGAKELQNALAQLPEKLRNKVVRSAIREAFKPTMDHIKAQTPVRTGRLKASWHLRAASRSRKSRRFRMLGVYIASGTREQLGIPLAAPYYYPAALEFGTKNLQSASFVRSTLRQDESQILQRLEERIGRGMETVVARELQRLTLKG